MIAPAAAIKTKRIICVLAFTIFLYSLEFSTFEDFERTSHIFYVKVNSDPEIDLCLAVPTISLHSLVFSTFDDFERIHIFCVKFISDSSAA